jgi:hypothetical protein
MSLKIIKPLKREREKDKERDRENVKERNTV